MASLNNESPQVNRGRLTSPNARLNYGTPRRGRSASKSQKKKSVLCSPREDAVGYRSLDEDGTERKAEGGGPDEAFLRPSSPPPSTCRSRGRSNSSELASISSTRTQLLETPITGSAQERVPCNRDGQPSDRGASLYQKDATGEIPPYIPPEAVFPIPPVASSSFTGRLVYLLSSLKELVSDRCACSGFIRKKKERLPLERKKTGSSTVKVDLTEAGRERPLVEDCVRGLGWETWVSFFRGGDIRWLGNAVADYEHEMHVASSLVLNRFPGFHELTKKRSFARVLSAMQELQPDEFSFFPLTWVLPEDRAALEVVLRTQPKTPRTSPPFPPPPLILPQPPMGGPNRHFLAAEKIAQKELSKPQPWPSFYHVASGSLDPRTKPSMCGFHRSATKVMQVREPHGQEGGCIQEDFKRQKEKVAGETARPRRGGGAFLAGLRQTEERRGEPILRQVRTDTGFLGRLRVQRPTTEERGNNVSEGRGTGGTSATPRSGRLVLRRNDEERQRVSAQPNNEDREAGGAGRATSSRPPFASTQPVSAPTLLPAQTSPGVLPFFKRSLFGSLLPLRTDHLFPRFPRTVKPPDILDLPGRELPMRELPGREPVSRARPSPLLTLFPLPTWSPVYTSRRSGDDDEEGEDGPEDRRDVFIMKPDCGAQGMGVRLLCSGDSVPKDILDGKDGYVVQQYIANPYLLDGKKFDFRIYVLVLNVVPQPQVFISRRGLVRFCTEDYERPNEGNLDNAFMHLTNYAINKEHRLFRRSDNVHARDSSKRLLEDVFEELLKNGVDVGNVWRQVVAIVERTMTALTPLLCLRYRSIYNRETCRCFQIIGFDILLDKQCKAWLLEVNANPSLRSDYDNIETCSGSWGTSESQLDRHIKEPLVREALILVYFSAVGPRMALNKNSGCQCRKALYSSMRQHAEHTREKEKKRLHLRRISFSPTDLSRSHRRRRNSPVYVSLHWRRLVQRPPAALAADALRGHGDGSDGVYRRSFSQGEQGIFCSSAINWEKKRQPVKRRLAERRPKPVAAAAARPVTRAAAAPTLFPASQRPVGFPPPTSVAPSYSIRVAVSPAVAAASDCDTLRQAILTPTASAGPPLHAFEDVPTTADLPPTQQEARHFLASPYPTVSTAAPGDSAPRGRRRATSAARQAAVQERRAGNEQDNTQELQSGRKKLQKRQQQAARRTRAQRNEKKTPKRPLADSVPRASPARRAATGETLLPLGSSIRSPATTTATIGARGHTPVAAAPCVSSQASAARRSSGYETPVSPIGSGYTTKRCRSYFNSQIHSPTPNISEFLTCFGPVVVASPAENYVTGALGGAPPVGGGAQGLGALVDWAAGDSGAGGAAGAAVGGAGRATGAAAPAAATCIFDLAAVGRVESSSEVQRRGAAAPRQQQAAVFRPPSAGDIREGGGDAALLPCKRRAASMCASEGKSGMPPLPWSSNGGGSPRSNCTQKTEVLVHSLPNSRAESPRSWINKSASLQPSAADNRAERRRTVSQPQRSRDPSTSVKRKSRAPLRGRGRSCSSRRIRGTETQKSASVYGGGPECKKASQSGAADSLKSRRRRAAEAAEGETPQKRDSKGRREQGRRGGGPVRGRDSTETKTTNSEQLGNSLAAAVATSTHTAACVFSRNLASQCCVWEPLTVISPLRQSAFDPFRRCVRRLLELSAPLMMERCRHLFERVTCFPVRRTVHLEDWLTLCRQSRLVELIGRLWVAVSADERSAPPGTDDGGSDANIAVRTCKRFEQRQVTTRDLVLLYMRQLKEEVRTQAGTASLDNSGLSFWFFWELLCFISSMTDLLIMRHRDFSNSKLAMCRLVERKERDFMTGPQAVPQAVTPRESVKNNSTEGGARPGRGNKSEGNLTSTGETATGLSQQEVQQCGVLTRRRSKSVNDAHEANLGKGSQSLDSLAGTESAKRNVEEGVEGRNEGDAAGASEEGKQDEEDGKWNGIWNSNSKGGRLSRGTHPLWFIHQKTNLSAGPDEYFDASGAFNTFLLSESIFPPKGLNIDLVVRPGDRVFVSWLPDIRKGFYAMTTEQRTTALDCLLSFFAV